MTEYEKYESRSFSKTERRRIDGRTTGCGCCTGYCKYAFHPGFLTKELEKEHRCAEKGCFHYVPREKTKEKRENTARDFCKEILKSAERRTTSFEGIRVTRAAKSGNGYTVWFAAITNDFAPSVISDLIADEFGTEVTFKKLECDYELSAKLVIRGTK